MRAPFRLVALLAALAACAPPALMQSDGRPVVTDFARARAEAETARLRLDSALRDGNVPRILELLDDQLVVVLSNGDSLVGRAAVARRLSERWDDARAAALHLFPGKAELCLDGIVETAGDATIFIGRAQRADTISERVRVTYRNGGPGRWRIARAEFGRERADALPDNRSCARVDNALYDRRRVRISASFPGGLQTLVNKTSVENQLRKEGYQVGLIPSTSILNQTFGTPDGTIEQNNGWISVRGRVVGEWWVDLVVGYGSSSFTSYGFNPVAGSKVRIDAANGVTGAVLVQREWKGWRAGFGPVLLNQTWHFVEDRHVLVPSPILDSSATASSVGALAELGWSRNIGSTFLVDVRLWQRLGGSTPLPAFGTVVGGGSTRLDATSLFVGLGIAF